MNNFTLSRVASALLLASLVSGAQAAEVNTTTPTVKGHAPVASAVSIQNVSNPGAQPRVGDDLNVTYTFTDSDGDPQSGSLLQWLSNGGAIAGAVAATYKTVTADTGKNLAARVTPQTNPANTDPSSGAPVTSASVTVLAAGAPIGIGRFIAPDLTVRTWAAANSYCQGLGSGARLPTQTELQQHFVDATSSPAYFPNAGYINNIEMCSKHGWPLDGQCGGSSHTYYWSSTPGSAGTHYYVSLNDGSASSTGGSSTFQVACVR